jgi:signal transduction histidine kinase
MYLKKVKSIKNRLTFKLTFLYIVLFIISSSPALSIFFLRVSSITLNRTDVELLEEINEFSQEKNLQVIVSEITKEMESEDKEKLFFRLLNVHGDIIRSWNTESFDTLDLQEDTIKTLILKRCTLHADKNKLQRMITNLLENAIKYTNPGGHIFISITLDEDKVIMKFKDTGIGIEKADLSKIFNRFYRCDKSRSGEGIGLGLSLVKAIVEASGGTIEVISQIGKGSQFIVSFPQYISNIS